MKRNGAVWPGNGSSSFPQTFSRLCLTAMPFLLARYSRPKILAISTTDWRLLAPAKLATQLIFRYLIWPNWEPEI